MDNALPDFVPEVDALLASFAYEPSRGIDIGAKAEVFRLLAERAAKGLAVVFSTSEVAECLSIAHRIIVMRRGRISAEFGADAAKEEIMAASGEAVVVQ